MNPPLELQAQINMVNSVLTALVRGQQSQDLLTVLLMLKTPEIRKTFLVGCRRRAPVMQLTVSSFQYMADVFRVILREANNNTDFIDVREVFDLSSLFGMSRYGAIILLKAGIRWHEAWRNDQFWLHCFRDMVNKDREHVAHEYEERVDTMSQEFFQMQPIEFRSFLIVNRAQAMARSMKSLGLKNSTIKTIIHTCASEFPGEDLSAELFKKPSSNFTTWLLDVALIATEKELEQPIDNTLNFNSRPRYSELGYSSLQELIFFIIDKLCKTNILVKQPGICFCGTPLGGWQPLGLYDGSATQREYLPLLICEQCYRLLAVDPLRGYTNRSGCLTTLGRAAVPVIAPLAPSGVFQVFEDTKYIGDVDDAFRPSKILEDVGISKDSERSLSGGERARLDIDFKEPDSEQKERLSRGHMRFQERQKLMGKFIKTMQAGMDVIKCGHFGGRSVRTLFINQAGDTLCWVPPGLPDLVPSEKHSIPLIDLQRIRIGSGEYEQAVAIESANRTLVVKVQEEELFGQLIQGLHMLIESNHYH